MESLRWVRRVTLAVFGATLIGSCVPAPAAAEVVVLRATDEGALISVDGRVVGTLSYEGSSVRLRAGATRVRIERAEERRVVEQAFPVHVVVGGELEDRGSGLRAHVRQEYDLLAPAAPIDIEGLGLVVPGEDPDFNREEHDRLRSWLGARGLAPDTGIFEELHQRDTGRALRVWYEIAGRRVDGSVTLGDADEPVARFDSAFHVTDEGWKIHHARELFYHRQSLERVDVLTDLRGPVPRALRSYQCGCYGWAIGGDWVTVGDDRLYHVPVEWRHHRVGAGFFLGLQTVDRFPWVRWADRDRVSRLARRASAYRLTDATGETFAEIAIGLDPDPAVPAIGRQSYDVRVGGADGSLGSLARVDAEPGRIEIRLAGDGESGLERFDVLLAAMPTQVLRGDGRRDGYLGQVETLIDWVRLLRSPNEDTLADVVSEIDATTALAKVDSLLASPAEDFAIEDSDYRPLPPRHGTTGAFPRLRSGDTQ